MNALKKQLHALKAYGNEAVEANAHQGLIFYIVIIAFGILVYQTM